MNECSQDKATNREIAALRDVLGCITDYNLETQFPPKDIERRVLELEKLKAERRTAASTSAVEVGPKQPDVKKCDNSGSARKQQVQPQNRNKRARTAVSTVRPHAMPVPAHGGHGHFGYAGNYSLSPYLGAGQQFVRNHYLFHF